jgi:hypothetical protein
LHESSGDPFKSNLPSRRRLRRAAAGRAGKMELLTGIEGRQQPAGAADPAAAVAG